MTAWPYRHPPNTQFTLNQQSPQARGLIGWWPTIGQYGRLGLRDYSEHGRHGTFAGTTFDPTWVQTNIGPALSYDGGDYVDLGTHAAFYTLMDNFSLSIWGWVTSFPSFRGLLSSKIGGANTHWSLACNAPLLTFYLSDTSSIEVDANPPTGTWFHFVGTRVNGTAYCYLNGVRQTSTTTGAPNDTTSRGVVLGRWRSDSSALYFPGRLADGRIYNRGLSDTDVAAMYQPQTRHDLYAPIPRLWPVPFVVAETGGGTEYELAVDTGSYTITGQDITLTADRALAADTGEYAVTGQDVGLTIARTLAADTGEYAIAGQDVGLTVDRTLAVDTGTYAVTGQDVSLTIARVLNIETGIYTLTGNDIALTYAPVGGYALSVDTGSYAISGQAVNLTVSRQLAVDTGEYTFFGQDVGLSRGFVISVETGNYTLTGQAIAFIWAHVLAVNTGTYTISGQAVTLTWSGAEIPVTPDHRIYIVNEEDRAFIVPADNRIFVIGG